MGDTPLDDTGLDWIEKTTPDDAKHLSPSERQRFILLQQQRLKLERETLKLFRPQEHQRRIFLSQSRELLVRGGNRSGKSICTGILVAGAACNQRIYDIDGTQFPMYAPNQVRHDEGQGLRIWCIGAGESHIGKTFYRLLREPGQFKIIQDEVTKEWRTFHPVKDAARRKDAKKAGPFIPDRMVKDIAWKNKKSSHFDVIKLTNGTEIHAFTSGGDPKMGDPCDLIWIDEAIKYEKHFPEWQARLIDYSGRLVWSLYPGNVNIQVRRLWQAAKDYRLRGVENPRVDDVAIAMSANTFFTDKQKEETLEGWSEEEITQRDRGEFFFGASRMYPHFDPEFHKTPCPDTEADDVVDEEIRKWKGIPDGWCYSLIVDPGTSHPGIMLVATCPEELWKKVGGRVDVVCGEVYLPNSDASEQVDKAKPMVQGLTLQRMIMDFRAGRQKGMGRGLTTREHYRREFEAAGIKCVASDSNLVYASDEVLGGLQAVRLALRPRANGRPQLRYLSSLTHFPEQMETYLKGQNAAGHVVDTPADGQIDPMCDMTRYFCVGEYPYVRPPHDAKANRTTAFEVWEKYFKPKPKKSRTYCGAGTAD